MKTILCLTNFFKGQRLLETFKSLGCHTIVLGASRVQHSPWPKEHVDETFFVDDLNDLPSLLNVVSYLACDHEIDLVVPLEEYAVETASHIRAHLGLPGLDEGVTRRCRDKLAMRLIAQQAGIPIPEFSTFINRVTLSHFLNSVPGPWMVKPRSEGGSVQIHKLHTAQEVWDLFEELGDRRSHHLIEAFVPGQVYHVDSIVYNGKVLFANTGQYGAPPFNVWHGGGVFSSRTVAADHPLASSLLQLNTQIIKAIGIKQGVCHVEFLGLGDQAYFLEIGARVAGSNLDRLTTAARGIDLFVESARLELHWLKGMKTYKLPKTFHKESGIVLCLSHEEHPKPEVFNGIKEIVWTLQRDYHAGCVVASSDSDRIDDLVKEILKSLEQDYLAVMPATEKPL